MLLEAVMPIGELFGRLRQSLRPARASPPPLHEQPLSFAEIVAAASFLDFGGVPIDALTRGRGAPDPDVEQIAEDRDRPEVRALDS
jgi:hypothetical protein